jgi:protein subunit release factor A
VNKSESGCRLTHLPTGRKSFPFQLNIISSIGIILERQDERFFNLNKNLAIKAMKNK